MSKKRLTREEYTEMALDFERGGISPVGEPVYGNTILRKGRPVGHVARGDSPVRSFRLPEALSALLDQRAEDDHESPSEVTRKALTQYLMRS